MNNYEEYEALIKKTLSPYRFHHSMCVAKRARELAERHGVDPDKAYLAGILHDITKEMPDEEQTALIEKYDRELTYVERGNHRVLHQMSGAVYVRHILGITDEDIVSGIRYHTTGHENMTLFEMLIYLADFTSEDRNYPDVDTMRQKTDENLLEGMRYSLQYTVISVAKENRLLHPDTLNCFNWVLYKLNENQK